MSATLVPVKTPDGVDELSSRQRKLSQRHRTVLLLVDGSRHEAQVRDMAQQAGAPERCFDELVSLGLIAWQPRPVNGKRATEAGPVSAPASASDTVLPDANAIARADTEAEAEPPQAANDSSLSLLPASLTLAPESSLLDMPSGDMGLESQFFDVTSSSIADLPLAEARQLLSKAVRAEAPVAGSLTLMRLKRARTREAVTNLLPEVEARITKPARALWAAQTLQRARELLASPESAVAPPA